jgi:hypothetical protein
VALAAVFFGPKPVLSGPTYRHMEFVDGVADERGVWYERYGLLSPTRDWPPIGPRPTSRPTEYQVTCAGRDGLTNREIFWIDMCGLTDALLSRLPAVRSRDWRVGHHLRRVPTDYGNVLVGRTAELFDPAVQELLDDVQVVISGPLFSVERMRAIVRLNLGRSYRYDRDTYADPGVQVPWSSLVTQVDYVQARREPPEDGTQWLVPASEGVFWPQPWVATSFDAGLRIVVRPSIPAQAISLSLDGNDAYRVTLNGGEYSVRIERSSRVGEGGGLVSHRIELPEPRSIGLVEIEPIEGDGFYGLGHVSIEGGPDADAAPRS